MRILMVTPAPPRSVHGNRVTALRWARLLRSLGHRVRVRQDDDGSPTDLLIALHARRSAAAIRRVRAERSGVPVVLALTGTDLYPSLAEAGVDPDVLAAADRLVVLQPLALDQLPVRLRDRARVIYQSAGPLAVQQPEPDRSARQRMAERATAAGEGSAVALLAHLRPVKDPLLPARAVRLLPPSSSMRVCHAGAVIDPALGERAAAETRTNSRYTWLGALPPARARSLLAASRALVHPSRHEGGANVVSEALALGVPVLATRIPGTVGILGPDHPGYFPVGDPAALADLLTSVERDAGFYDELRRHCAALRPLTSPSREQASWQALLAELSG
jgi:putative glycosyltransferase (TIGR04348 family)